MAHVRWLLASLTVVAVIAWTALYFLPTNVMAAILGILIVFVAVAGLIKLVLITLTPPR